MSEIEGITEEEIQRRMVVAQVASCRCDTKTPDPKHHAEDCPYAALALGEIALTAALSRNKELEEAISELDKLSLVIESAVRAYDTANHGKVLNAIRRARADMNGGA